MSSVTGEGHGLVEPAGPAEVADIRVDARRPSVPASVPLRPVPVLLQAARTEAANKPFGIREIR
jgi:hypothetical protein